MKTRLSLFFAVLAAIAACQPAPSPKDETVELVNLGEDEYAFPVDGGEAIISFKSSNSWTVSCADDWVFVSQESGSAGYQDVEISVEPNQSAQLRTTLLCVSVDAEHSFNITVIQETSPVFSVSTDLLEIGPEGGRLTFGVNSNIEYEVSSVSDWLTIEDSNPDDGVVELMVSAYEGSEDRTGGVRVKSAAGDDVFVKVVQELYLNDKVYGAEYYYYANYYTTKGVSWILNILNEDFFNPYGQNPKIYTIQLTLDPSYDYFYVKDNGLPATKCSLSDGYEPFTVLASGSYVKDYSIQEKLSFTEAELYEEEGVLCFRLVDSMGRKHKVRWQHNFDPARLGIYDKSYRSKVSTDYEVTFDGCKVSPEGQYLLDKGITTYQTIVYFGSGHPQFGTTKADSTEGSMLINSVTEEIEGVYTVQPASQQNFAAGTVDALNSAFYSTYTSEGSRYYVSDGYFGLGGGTLTVTKEGDEYVFEADFTDDYPYGEPHRLVLHARGKIEQSEGASVKSISLNEYHLFR